MENLEPRVLALESLILSMDLDALKSRLAAMENQSWQTTLGNSGGDPSTLKAIYPATTGVTAIPARATIAGVDTAGSGTVTLWEIDPATGAVAAGTTVTAWNNFTVAVTANKDIYIGWYVNANGLGMWVVPSMYCG